MMENAPSPASNEEAGLVRGEIVEVEDTRLRVRLESGAIGFVAVADVPDAGSARVGHRATFRIVAGGPADSPALTFVEHREAAAEEPFEREVVELNKALANHRPSNAVRPVERLHLGEEQIQDWIARVDESLGRFRKNRAKRLNEEFYNTP